MRRTLLSAIAAIAAAVSAAAAPSGPDGTAETSAGAVWRGVHYGSRGAEPGARRDTVQVMDVFAPSASPGEVPAAVLFIHGGLWAHGSRHYYRAQLRETFLKRGFVFCAPEFVLQATPPRPPRPEATFEAMLRDIDAAATRLGRFLAANEIRPAKYVIAGESSGAHLALLYACDQANPEALGLSLRHDVAFAVAVDAAGPVDLLTMDGGEPTADMSKTDPRLRARTVVKRLAGLSDDAPDDMLVPMASKWSPVNLVTPKCPYTILAYGRLAPFLPTDGLIPFAQMQSIEEKLKENGVKFDSKSLIWSRHDWVAADCADWIACRIIGVM